MLLAIIATLSFAEARPSHRPPHVAIHVEAEVRPISRWIGAHYNRWGRWIPGHWVTTPSVMQEVCRIERDGRVWCTII